MTAMLDHKAGEQAGPANDYDRGNSPVQGMVSGTISSDSFFNDQRAPVRPNAEASMAEPVSREELHAEFRALRAESDAKFERILGELRTSQAAVAGDIRALAAASAGKTTVIGMGIAVIAALAAVIFGLSASGQEMFSLGASVSDQATRAAHQAIADTVAKK